MYVSLICCTVDGHLGFYFYFSLVFRFWTLCVRIRELGKVTKSKAVSLETKAEVIHIHMYPVRYRCEKGRWRRRKWVHVIRGAEHALRTPRTSRETSKWSVRLPSSGTAWEGGLCKEARMLGKWKTAGERKAGRELANSLEGGAEQGCWEPQAFRARSAAHHSHTALRRGWAEAVKCSRQECTFTLRYQVWFYKTHTRLITKILS